MVVSMHKFIIGDLKKDFKRKNDNTLNMCASEGSEQLVQAM